MKIRDCFRAPMALLALAGAAWTPAALAQEDGPDFPPFAEVSKGYEKVVSTVDGQSFYTLWIRRKDGQILAELPRGWQGQKHFFAGAIAGGHPWAGLQSGYFYNNADRYAYWRRYDRRVALIAPQLEVKSTGDAESRDGVARHFTDRVLLDVPIVTMGPSGNPVIDMDDLIIDGAGRFFGGSASGLNANLATIKEVKAFPENVEISFEAPAAGGQLTTFHYSISLIPDNTGYRPRKADERLGYFTTEFSDFGKYKDDEVPIRYINRWHLEKRDPNLRLSPPKEPIVFYIEHTVPVRYRRWMKEGVLMWNKAFERVGIKDAIEVYYQDKETGAHMDKDPEDVRYNFILWLANNEGTAVGPSRTHPLTGQILDADVVITDGWIRYFWYQYKDLMPDILTQGFSPETLAWLETRPQWDPRLRLAPPVERNRILAERAARGPMPMGGHPAANVDSHLAGDDHYDGLFGCHQQHNGMCLAPMGKAMDMARAGLFMQIAGFADEPGVFAQPADPAQPGAGEPKKPEEPKEDTLDGIPESFVGPLLADLVAHEVGHTLGLRHNFKASSIYTLAQINSEEFKGKKPFTGSVMDYNPVNFNKLAEGGFQGDFGMVDIGPYDFWVIEYGYTTDEKQLPAILARVSEPELAFGTDEDTWGSDPLIRPYDFTSKPLDFAKAQVALAAQHRGKLLDAFVDKGEAWSKARRGYRITFFMQAQAVSMMAQWVGGAHVNRDRKGDPGNRAPIVPVAAADQRDALAFVLQNSFQDESFGLTPDMLTYFARDAWTGTMDDSAWPVHDEIMGFQASVMTMLLNPTTLKGVYDNELMIASDKDALTLPELLDTVFANVWKELDAPPQGQFSARRPMISSLRRNLQREHMERLIDLAGPDSGFSAAYKPISNLALAQLRDLKAKVDKALQGPSDPYTKAHLSEVSARVDKVLNATYIYNQASGSPFGGLFLRTAPEAQPPTPR